MWKQGVGLSPRREEEAEVRIPKVPLGVRMAVRMISTEPRTRWRAVSVLCRFCGSDLFRYAKGGRGKLVKCYKRRILKDFTKSAPECPGCGSVFARDAVFRGEPAWKIIGGKVLAK